MVSSIDFVCYFATPNLANYGFDRFDRRTSDRDPALVLLDPKSAHQTWGDHRLLRSNGPQIHRFIISSKQSTPNRVKTARDVKLVPEANQVTAMGLSEDYHRPGSPSSAITKTGKPSTRSTQYVVPHCN